MKGVFQSPTAGVGMAVLLFLVAFVSGGPLALAGAALGIGATTFSVVLLWLAVRQVGMIAQTSAKPSRGGVIVGLGFLIKLPLFVGAGMVAQGLGGPAPAWFLAGLGVVYFALVGWGMTRP